MSFVKTLKKFNPLKLNPIYNLTTSISNNEIDKVKKQGPTKIGPVPLGGRRFDDEKDNPSSQAIDFLLSGGLSKKNEQEKPKLTTAPTSAEPKRFDSELGAPPSPMQPRPGDEYKAVREQAAGRLLNQGADEDYYKESKELLATRPVQPTKDENGRLKSGLRKGGDAFLRSGNPFAFLFGGLSGATNDRLYDERKKYRGEKGDWDERYGAQFALDKEEAERASKNRGYRIDETRTAGTLLGDIQGQENKTNDGRRADTGTARLIMNDVARRGGVFQPGEKRIVEQAYGQPLPDAISPELSNELIRILDEQGAPVHAVVDKNQPNPEAQYVLGPNRQPAQVAPTSPLVTIGDITSDAKYEADATILPKAPAQIQQEALESAKKEAAQKFGADIVNNPGFFDSQIGKEIFERHLKTISDTDKQDVEKRRAGKVNDARKKHRSATVPSSNSRGSNNNVGPRGSVQDRIKKAFSQ